MSLAHTFKSALGNRAKFFAYLGIAYFSFSVAILAVLAWQFFETLSHGVIPLATERVQAFLLIPLGLGLLLTLVVSAFEFLRRVYRVRKFLIKRGKLQFPSWTVTLIAFAAPIANFFVPWNRLDIIRQTLSTYRWKREFVIPTAPERKLRSLGILWGISSLVTMSGNSDDPSSLLIELIAYSMLTALAACQFILATKWLSELSSDFADLEGLARLSP